MITDAQAATQLKQTLDRRQFSKLAAALGASITLGPTISAFAADTNPGDIDATYISNLLSDLNYATGAPPNKARHTLSDNFADVVTLAYSRLKFSHRYTTTLSTVSIGDGNTDYSGDRAFTFNNVIADHPWSSDSAGALTYVLCAHLDSSRNCPGGNDNGSGIAAVMAVAEAFSKYHRDDPDVRLKHKLRFVLVGGEEMGLLGSKGFAASVPSGECTAMRVINVDMIGGVAPPVVMPNAKARYSVEYRDSTGDQNFAPPLMGQDYFEDDTRSHYYNANWTLLADSGGTNSKFPSDHLSFNAKDVPVVSISQLPSYPLMHTPEDTFDHTEPNPVNVNPATVYDVASRLKKYLVAQLVPA